MKKLYKQLMKTSALVCLFILGTGNAWASTTWTKSTTVTFNNEWNAIGNTNVQIKSVTGLSYKSSTGITVAWKSPKAEAKFKKDNSTKYVAFTLKAGANGKTLTITGSDGYTGSFNLTTTESVLILDMQQSVEYTFSADAGFNITRVEVFTEGTDYFTLDETVDNSVNKSTISTNVANNAKISRISIKRTLKANQWNTFCVPVNVWHDNNSDPTIADVFKCNAVYEMTDYDPDHKTITFTAVEQGTKGPKIPANTPVLIKPTKDVVNPLIKGAYGQYVVAPTDLTVSYNGLSFIGVYGAENIYTDDHSKFYLNNEGYLVYPTSNGNNGNNGKIKGFRAYFEWTGGSSGVKDMTFVFDDSETTGIKTIEHDIFGENGRVYSIDGRYMGDSTDNLSRGIYIQNGRKFVVK
jgi:hypothetical protein